MTFQLEVEYDYDFLILGVSCHERDYRMCWLINKTLGFDLSRDEDLVLHVGGEKVGFPIFSYEIPEELTRIFLIKNRVPEGVLLPAKVPV